MKQEWNYRRGDVYLADLGEPIGSEQGGIRPVAVIQNESGCRRSTTMTVVPLTSNLKKLDQPTHYVLRLRPSFWRNPWRWANRHGQSTR